MKNFVLCFLAFLVIPSLVFGYTEKSGTISGETWTTANHPYHVIGDIYVASLTIEPGVEVIFMGDYSFEVTGILTAIGTEQDTIYFSKPDSVAGWQGILLEDNQFGSEFKYCKIERATNSAMIIDNSNPTIEHCTIANNSGSGGGLMLQLQMGLRYN